MSTHEKRSASDAAAWFICPGKIRMCEGLSEGEPSYDAQLGTAVHALNEACLGTGTDPKKYYGHLFWADAGTDYQQGFTMGDAEVAASALYVGYIRGVLASSGRVDGLCERKVTLDHIYPETGGTSDYRATDWVNGILWVIDYKNGRRHVSPKWNKQLMIYALAAAHGLDPEIIHTVRLAIVQPNIGGDAVAEWDIPTRELRRWGVEVLHPACSRTDDPDAPLCAHPDACRYCLAKVAGTCPEALRYANALALVPMMEKEFLPVEGLEAEHLERMVDSLDMFVGWLKQGKAYMRQQAQSGAKVFPNYKLVEGRADRCWNEKAESVLVDHLGEEAYNRKLKGLGDTEKALKAADLDVAAIMAQVTDKPAAPLRLVPRTSSKVEVTPATMFKVLAPVSAFDR